MDHMPKRVEDLLRKKSGGEPVVMLTCYDFPTAQREDAAGADVIFVGDSVGTNVLGYASVRDVTMDDMLHHLGAVRRGATEAFLLADMPYRSFETPALAVENARRFAAAGAGGVKLEGGAEVVSTVVALRHAGIAVCGHLGFTPQTAGPRGRVVGKTAAEARKLLADARALEGAGVFMLVLELVPEELSQAIARSLSCVVIGIGSGTGLDGEVQVVNDILGVTERPFRHTKRFAAWRDVAGSALREFVEAVKARRFPAAEHAAHLPPEVSEALRDDLAAYGRAAGHAGEHRHESS
jgi:3-methyl-2-oxobutanoate hydroxymethyltransferase